MRWGVPEDALENHTISQLCIDEIKKCQEVSVGPNFVTLLGHKYGYRPMPNTLSEEIFTTLTEVAQEAEDKLWDTVQIWYIKDANSNPQNFVLQSISSIIPGYNNTEEENVKNKAQKEWWNVENNLIEALRRNATRAFEQGKISADQKHLFFMSVTENEVRHGIIAGQTDPKDTVVAIVRNIPDINNFLSDRQAPRFADTIPSQTKIDEEAANHLTELRDKELKNKIPEENITKVEVEWLACGANISVDTVKDVAIAKFAQKFVKSREMNISKHRRYLKAMCRDFQKRIIHLINEGGEKNIKSYDELTTELLQHQHLAKTRCEVFEGREDVMQQVQAYLKDASMLPLIIYGHSGCGKTSVISRIFEFICNKETIQSTDESEIKTKAEDAVHAKVESNENLPAVEHVQSNTDDSKVIAGSPLVILRFLGTSPLTSTIQQVLVTVCQQISTALQLPWIEPEKFSELSKSFKEMLKLATKEKPIILLIDSIDQLMPVCGAYKVDWLPKTLPPHVKVVLSTLVEDYPVYKNLKKRYEESGSKFIEILPLGDEVGMTIIKRWLENSNRTITEEQEIIVRKALTICSLPLYARITYSHVMRWASYYQPDNDILAATVQEAISTMFQQMETKLGAPLVKHSLALLTASRYGLSEVELEHTLSLDDDFLAHVYKFWKPPIRRVPPLLWTRVRNEISNYIVERSVDGILVMYWYHRQFIAATKARYLADPQFLNYVHTILAEYYLGKWGGGKAKPFEYTEHQKHRFALQDTKSQEDRKVPSQPFIYSSHLDSRSLVRFNQRKVSELPLHLFKSNQLDNMLREVFFNYEWIYSKMKTSSPRALLQEYELFMLADQSLKQNYELKLLVANLQMMRPFIAKLSECLSVELIGRLVNYAGKQPHITSLIQQCDTIGIQQCPLSPVMTCYETADVGLKQNIHIRDTDPWHEGGAITCTKDFKTLYVLDYSIEGASYISQWDIKSGDKVGEKMIQKPRDESIQESDVYFYCSLDKSEKIMIGLYKKRYYDGGLDKKLGYIDLMHLDTCEVYRSYEYPLQKSDFYNSLQFITENWVSARFGRQIPMFSIHGEKKEVSLKTPSYLSHSEQLQVLVYPKLPSITMQDGKPVRLETTRQRMGEVKVFSEGRTVADLDRTEESVGVGISQTDKLVALIDLKGDVLVHDISGLETVTHPKKIKIVIPHLSLPPTERVTSIDIHDGEKFDAYHQQVVETKAVFSPDEKYLITIYQSAWRSKWEAFLWNLSNLKFVKRLAREKSTRLKFPEFTADSNFVIMTSDDKQKILLIYSGTGQVVKTYDINHTIRDFVISPNSTEIALLLQKDVRFVDANPDEFVAIADIQEQGPSGESGMIALLPPERTTNQRAHPRLMIHEGKTVEEQGILKKYEDKQMRKRPASAGSRPGSASSIRHLAIDTWETPDGEKLVQLHSRAQVIDTKEEAIKYTPHGDDKVVFSKTEDGTQEEEWDAFAGEINLHQNDKIVGNDKTRFRVTTSEPERVKILCVPSVLRISIMEMTAAKSKKKSAATIDTECTKPKEKLKRLKKITIFQENVINVSNNFLVTIKHMKSGGYVNVYDLETGKCVTYPGPVAGVGCARVSLDESRLYVASMDRSMKILPTCASNQFQAVTISPLECINTQFMIHDIILFQKNINCVLRYADDGPESHFKNTYVHVHVTDATFGQSIETGLPLEDISSDGELGITNDLKIYNMVTGVEATHMSTSGDAQAHIQARISDDKSTVVFINLGDDTLHVYDVSRDVHVATCFTHSRQWMASEYLSLRQSGRVITVSGGTGVSTFVIKDNKDTGAKLNHLTDYHSDLTRGKALMKWKPAPVKLAKVEKLDPVPAMSSMLDSSSPLPPIKPSGERQPTEQTERVSTPLDKDMAALERGCTPLPALPPISNSK